MSQFIERDPEKLSGAPVFKGTRVLVQSLFDYLEGGDSIDEFLSDFPTVSRTQITGLLEELKLEAIPDPVVSESEVA
ncbi:DUF433 domain-containing protein [bacterium]|nr:DUF433 domain-containing protein [bacterium]